VCLRPEHRSASSTAGKSLPSDLIDGLVASFLVQCRRRDFACLLVDCTTVILSSRLGLLFFSNAGPEGHPWGWIPGRCGCAGNAVENADHRDKTVAPFSLAPSHEHDVRPAPVSVNRSKRDMPGAVTTAAAGGDGSRAQTSTVQYMPWPALTSHGATPTAFRRLPVGRLEGTRSVE
jgi:hypothetical protein